jgi:hypothetical protein
MQSVLITTDVESLSVTCGRLMVFSTNKTDCHDITETLLKALLNTIKHIFIFLQGNNVL